MDFFSNFNMTTPTKRTSEEASLRENQPHKISNDPTALFAVAFSYNYHYEDNGCCRQGLFFFPSTWKRSKNAAFKAILNKGDDKVKEILQLALNSKPEEEDWDLEKIRDVLENDHDTVLFEYIIDHVPFFSACDDSQLINE